MVREAMDEAVKVGDAQMLQLIKRKSTNTAVAADADKALK